ncbi:protein artemis-like [Antedon mediterranea]|uniref:protein artemis-like n=1 Tax=Antedon mediterranea TaxID=105859 RepID=UPI003AF51C90
MSTFGGTMAEYPHVVIDRFVGALNMKATAYFLSHAHTDHMVGLGSSTFSKRLKKGSPDVKLYCSSVTKLLLLKDDRFEHLQPHIECLPINQPTSVVTENYSKNESLIVTLLPAGHCPGSVMFLFEGVNGVVLYTGDFRLSKGDAALISHLHSGSSIKDIKCIYADTTFCTPMAMHIPSREQSLDSLLDLVGRHISKSKENHVKMVCRAKYGYEYLFVELSKAFNMKVHVSSYMMMHYQTVSELASHMTSDGTSTQLHACGYTTCNVADTGNTIVIKPSTMWFTSNAQPEDILKKIDDSYYRLCFSFHSSYSEIRDFIGYLKPWQVKANVIPMKCSEEDIIERLSDLVRVPVVSTNASCSIKTENLYKPLGSLKKKPAKRKQKDKDASLEYNTLFGDQKIKKKKSSVKNNEADTSVDANQCDHDSIDGAISETGSDKVMKYGWQHFNNSLEDILNSEMKNEKYDSDLEADMGGDKDITCGYDQQVQYDIGNKSDNKTQPSNKKEPDFTNKVSDWLQYLPSTNENKTTNPENKSDLFENIMDNTTVISEGKEILIKQEMQKQNLTMTLVSGDTDIQGESEKTEEYSVPDNLIKPNLAHNKHEKLPEVQDNTTLTCTKGHASHLPHVLSPKVSEDVIISDDDSTYVSGGRLSQGNSDIPGTPDSKQMIYSNSSSSQSNKLGASKVYKMINRRNINF